MPTGYTAKIQEDGFDIKNWLEKDISRNFGVCIAFRDNGDKTTEEMIETLEKEVKEAGKYHKDKLKELEIKGEVYFKYTAKDWEAAREKESSELQKDVDKDKKRTIEGRKKYEETLSKLIEYKIKTNGTVAEPMIKFAIDQINDSIDFDFPLNSTYYQDKCDKLSEMPEYIQEKQEDLTDDKVYHNKQLIEAQEREKNRLKYFKDYLEIIKGL